MEIASLRISKLASMRLILLRIKLGERGKEREGADLDSGVGAEVKVELIGMSDADINSGTSWNIATATDLQHFEKVICVSPKMPQGVHKQTPPFHHFLCNIATNTIMLHVYLISQCHRGSCTWLSHSLAKIL